MEKEHLSRKLAVILYADVVGSTSLPIQIHIPFGVQTPCVLHVPGSPGNIFLICSLLHPLKKWSLRQTRGDSNLHRSWINGTVTKITKENKSNSFRELKIGKQ